MKRDVKNLVYTPERRGHLQDMSQISKIIKGIVRVDAEGLQRTRGQEWTEEPTASEKRVLGRK
jgi:hypothetical protein